MNFESASSSNRSKNNHDQRTPTLIVVGAGPKAAAISAKTAVLRDLGYKVPKLIIADRTGIGAHWNGDEGLTDGLQTLCTTPLRDVGFPYPSNSWGENSNAVNAGMANFSWAAYLIERGSYADWLNRASPYPTHREFSSYLTWVFGKSGQEILLGDITGFSIRDEQWEARYLNEKSDSESTPPADGLVITGPGNPVPIPMQPVHQRITDGASFWTRFKAGMSGRLSTAAIIGSGATAATIAAALADRYPQITIDMINRHAVGYLRDETFRHLRYFTHPDESGWRTLTQAHREDFIRRTDRSVFPPEVDRRLGQSQALNEVPGEVVAIQVIDPNVVLQVRYDNRTRPLNQLYDHVVVALGFDPCSFIDFLDAECIERLRQAAEYQPIDRHHELASTLARLIDSDLSLRGMQPRLHLPMLGGLEQGPGFPNLHCLGLLADRILRPYIS